MNQYIFIKGMVTGYQLATTKNGKERHVFEIDGGLHVSAFWLPGSKEAPVQPVPFQSEFSGIVEISHYGQDNKKTGFSTTNYGLRERAEADLVEPDTSFDYGEDDGVKF